MIRSELIEKLSVEHELSTREATLATDAFFDTIQEALEARKRVEIRGFATFGTKQRDGKIGRNPKTGEEVDVPAKYVVVFRTGRDLQKRLNPSSDEAEVSA